MGPKYVAFRVCSDFKSLESERIFLTPFRVSSLLSLAGVLSRVRGLVESPGVAVLLGPSLPPGGSVVPTPCLPCAAGAPSTGVCGTESGLDLPASLPPLPARRPLLACRLFLSASDGWGWDVMTSHVFAQLALCYGLRFTLGARLTLCSRQTSSLLLCLPSARLSAVSAGRVRPPRGCSGICVCLPSQYAALRPPPSRSAPHASFTNA